LATGQQKSLGILLYFGNLHILSNYGDPRKKKILENLATLVHFVFPQKCFGMNCTGFILAVQN
jgi:hypothetical protein